jgi:hypothetical protein
MAKKNRSAWIVYFEFRAGPTEWKMGLDCFEDYYDAFELLSKMRAIPSVYRNVDLHYRDVQTKEYVAKIHERAAQITAVA